MKLTEYQIAIMQKRVEEQGLKLPKLRDDVIDHLCCVIEYGLEKGVAFETLLDEAILELAPHGLNDLQRRTVFLLNSKRILIMKKLLYTTGFLGSVSLTAGFMFKILHYPYGTVLFISGLLMLLLVFVPLFAFSRYKLAISKTREEKSQLILGAVAAIITGFAGLFKLFHLMGANVLLMLGAAVFAFGFLPFLFISMYRKSVS